MQTIKTAAIVVLMLTVLYGGYVSLTTPPEPLPDEINDILVIDESVGGSFDTGEGLADGLELSQPPEGVLISESPTNGASGSEAPSIPGLPTMQPMSSAESVAVAPQPQAAPAVASNPPAAPAPVTYGSSFADLAPSKMKTDSLDPSASPSTTKLPAVDNPGVAVVPGPVDSYASTDDQFELPDMSVAQTKFDPSRGVPFTSDTEFQISDQPGTALEAVAGSAAKPKVNRGLTNAFATADAMFAKGQLKEALATLSVFYGTPDLDPAQKSQLLSRLDPLAREVIYSKRHLLEQPHRVGTSETLIEIAGKYDVPWQLLANINQVEDPVTVLPGTELKIVRGPFRAEVDLNGKHMTLFLGDLYAGRFEVAVGNDPPPTPGTFTIQEKQTAHVYYDRSGVPVQPGSPDNPYGGMWLDLGGQICIHGSPNTVQPTDKGCISIADDFADDVFAILSQGSSVTIRR